MTKQELIEKLSQFKKNMESVITTVPPTGETAILRDVYQASVSSYETAIQLVEQLDEPPSEPEQKPCYFCNEFQAMLKAGFGIEVGEVGIFYDPFCPNCGRKIKQ